MLASPARLGASSITEMPSSPWQPAQATGAPSGSAASVAVAMWEAYQAATSSIWASLSEAATTLIISFSRSPERKARSCAAR